jgi:RNA methyltransferase, TrmH family
MTAGGGAGASPLAAGNPAIKRLRRLGRDPAVRRQEQRYVAEGPRVVAEMVAADAPIEAVYIDAGHLSTADDAVQPDAQRDATRWVEQWSWLDELEDDRCHLVRPGVLDRVLDAAHPQGIAAVVRLVEADPSVLSMGPPALALVVAGVSDPGNLGTLVRSAVAAGASVVAVDPAGADPYGPKAVRASAGSLARTTVLRLPAVEAIHELRDAGAAVWLADATADRTVDDLDLSVPTAFVVGHEARGVPIDEPTRSAAGVAIPMAAGIESLNVAMAGTVLLFEAARQRRARLRIDGRPGEGRA